MITIDPHVHTVHSKDSPCGVEEAILAAKVKGLDGIAITDHDTVAGLEEAFEISRREDFLAIPGIEITSKDGHILGLGIREQIPLGLSAAETVRRIREKGGIAVAAHPFGLGLKPFSILRAEFDAIEVFNSRRYLGNLLAKRYALENDLPRVAGSDAHHREEIGLAGVKMESCLQVDKLLRKIKDGETTTFGRLLSPYTYLRRIISKLITL